MTDLHRAVPSSTTRRAAGPDPVEIWCASLDRWVQGFETVESGPDGHLVRRCSDGSLLPVRFGEVDVRPVPYPNFG